MSAKKKTKKAEKPKTKTKLNTKTKLKTRLKKNRERQSDGVRERGVSWLLAVILCENFTKNYC